jgi:lysophospholipase L1-like esterase
MIDRTTQATPARRRLRRGPGGRRLQPAGEALVAMTVALSLWTLLVAPRLERAAEGGPFGARRSVSLVILRPLAAMNEAFRLPAVSMLVDRATGGAGESGVQPPAEPLPTLPPGPSPGPDGQSPEEEAFQPLPPLSEGKIRMVVVGDSLAVGLSRAIGASLDPDRVRVVNQGRLSSGLARPDAFDWPAEVGRIARAFRPHVVVVMVGSNDAQPVGYPGGRVVPLFTHEWVEAYRRQIHRLLVAAERGGARVVWASMPPMKDRFRHIWARRLNDHYQAETAGRPGVALVDTWSAFAGRGGRYRAYARDVRGRTQLIRAGDGVHFSATGYRMLATLVIQRVRQEWDLDRRAISELVPPPA